MPITRLLYPECGGNTLDSHKAFTVHYKIGEDLDLSYHYDNAEVTLNVSLGKEFVGGELFFGDMRQVIYCIFDAKISNFQELPYIKCFLGISSNEIELCHFCDTEKLPLD